MKIIIPRAELKDAVAGLGKVVGSRSTLPILSSVRFDAGKGTVTVQATDLDQTVAYRFQNAQVEGSGACIVPFQVVKDLAKGGENETVELEPVDAENVAVTNHVGVHALTQNVAGCPVADWPPVGEKIGVHPAERFLPTYRRLAPFVSQDETRRIISGVYVDFRGEGVTLVATDGRRLTCCNSLSLPFKVKDGVIVPVTKFLTWAALGDECSVGVNKGKRAQVFGLETGPWTYQTKTTDGIYPNWRQVVPNKADLVQQFAFTDADVEAIKKLLPAFPGGEGIVIAGNADGKMNLAGRNKDEKAETTVQLTAGSRYTGTGARILVNRNFLLDALVAGFRNFGFADGQNPLMAEDENGAVHVLMPLRNDTPAPAPRAKPAAVPAQKPAEAVQPTPAAQPPDNPKEKEMPPENTTETNALERVMATYEIAKTKVREANAALADVADAIRQAIREDRQRRNEVENVRVGLAKIQAIRV
jgi:DNA polymerase-3 subunit beta